MPYCSKHADCGGLSDSDQNMRLSHLDSFLLSEAQLSALTFNPHMMPSRFCLFTYLCFYFGYYVVSSCPASELFIQLQYTNEINLNYEEKKMLSCTVIIFITFTILFSSQFPQQFIQWLTSLPSSHPIILPSFLYFMIVFHFTPL